MERSPHEEDNSMAVYTQSKEANASMALDTGVLTPPPSQRRKGRGVIVDVSLNDVGQQVYEVHGVGHNTKKRSIDLQQDGVLVDDEHIAKRKSSSPRTVLGTISQSSLNKDSGCNSHRDEESTGEEEHGGSPSSTLKHSSTDDNIWSDEVESAFEEALRMIPKNGLSKIKISGKSCGRNELISDYILQKTGKVRTRKQVSSHIQVIKNLKRNAQIIELINSGPTDPDALKRFDQVFTEIFFQKSLGSSTDRKECHELSTPKSRSRTHRSRDDSPVRRRRKPYIAVEPVLTEFQMKNSEGFVFTSLQQEEQPPLRLKKDACVQNRFPSLNDYYKKGEAQDKQIPIIHNLVKLQLSEEACTPQTDLKVQLKGSTRDEKSFSCKTVIYCYGNEVLNISSAATVLKLVKDSNTKLNNVTLSLPFAAEFWVQFFNSTHNNINNVSNPKQSRTQKAIGVKGLTMMQLIYHKNSKVGYEMDDIKALILWEFTLEGSDNETTTRRFFLPVDGVSSPEPTFLSNVSECETVEEHPKEQDDTISNVTVSDFGGKVDSTLVPDESVSPGCESYSCPDATVGPIVAPAQVLSIPAQVPNVTMPYTNIPTESAFIPMPSHQLPPRANTFQTLYGELSPQPIRRMMSEPVTHSWNNAANFHGELSSEGFNGDEFQGFSGVESHQPSDLNPGFTVIDQNDPLVPHEVMMRW